MAWTMASGTLLVTDTSTPMKAVQRTSRRPILAVEVPGLVASEKTGGLHLRSGAPGELLVEVDNALHAKGIRGGANSLRGPSCQLVFLPSRRVPFSIPAVPSQS